VTIGGSPFGLPGKIVSRSRKELEELLRVKRRRLYVLESQAAKYGPDNTPSHIKLEIKKMKEEIDSLEESLNE
jgi:hypothetical protein